MSHGTEEIRNVSLVENDTQPQITVTYENIDVSEFEILRAHIGYQPFSLALDGIVSDDDATTFSFPVNDRVTGVLAADANIGDTAFTVTVTQEGKTFSSLPESGEIEINHKHFLYTSKTPTTGESGTLALVNALTCMLTATTSFEKLPDYREGNYPMQLETVDSSGARMTFSGVILRIEKEIR